MGHGEVQNCLIRAGEESSGGLPVGGGVVAYLALDHVAHLVAASSPLSCSPVGI